MTERSVVRWMVVAVPAPVGMLGMLGMFGMLGFVPYPNMLSRVSRRIIDHAAVFHFRAVRLAVVAAPA